MLAQEQIHQGIGGGTLRQRGSAGHGVHTGGGRIVGQAALHGGAKGHQHKHTGGDGGVDQVTADTAEQALDHHDGEEVTGRVASNLDGVIVITLEDAGYEIGIM